MGWPVCNSSLMDVGESTVNKELPVFGDWTFHELGLWLAAGFAIFASVVAFILIFLHATHYSKPWEQKHIIRILFMIPIYSTTSFLSYKFYSYSIYWSVGQECYEAFAIASFFWLLCHYLERNLHDQKNYFRTLKPENWVMPVNWFQKCTGGTERGPFRIPRSGLTWFNIIWIGVFQYCFIRVFFTVVAAATEIFGRYCESSLNPAFAHIWVMGFDALAVTIAMFCLIQFYVQVKTEIAEHHPFLKICCIKLVIFFSFWQNLAISFFSSGSKPLIKTGPHVSYVDVKVGIPSVLLCAEMAIFSIMHIFAFPWRPYDIKDSHDPAAHYSGGPLGLRAILSAFSPVDFIKAFARGLRWLFVGVHHRTEDVSYQGQLRPGEDASPKPPKEIDSDLELDAGPSGLRRSSTKELERGELPPGIRPGNAGPGAAPAAAVGFYGPVATVRPNELTEPLYAEDAVVDDLPIGAAVELVPTPPPLGIGMGGSVGSSRRPSEGGEQPDFSDRAALLPHAQRSPSASPSRRAAPPAALPLYNQSQQQQYQHPSRNQFYQQQPQQQQQLQQHQAPHQEQYGDREQYSQREQWEHDQRQQWEHDPRQQRQRQHDPRMSGQHHGAGGAPPYPSDEYQSLTGSGAVSPPILSPGLPPARREDERNPMEGRPLVGGSNGGANGRGRAPGRGDERMGQGGGGGRMF